MTSAEYEWNGGFRSAGGSDAPGNRITLCAFHHQRCLHAGLLRVSGRAPDGLFFELGLRPGASPLVRYRAGDIGVRPYGRLPDQPSSRLAKRSTMVFTPARSKRMRSFWPGPVPVTARTVPAPKIGCRTRSPGAGSGASSWP